MTAYFLLKGLDPNVENRFLETPLFIAAEMGSLEVLEILCSDGRCKADKTDKFGDTLMHLAARDGQDEIVTYLIGQYGRKLTKCKNQEGKTPLTLAIDNSQTKCIQVLRNFDATALAGDRSKLIADLAKKLIEEPADYRKSIFKHQPAKIETHGKIMSRI